MKGAAFADCVECRRAACPAAPVAPGDNVRVRGLGGITRIPHPMPACPAILKVSGRTLGVLVAAFTSPNDHVSTGTALRPFADFV